MRKQLSIVADTKSVENTNHVAYTEIIMRGAVPLPDVV